MLVLDYVESEGRRCGYGESEIMLASRREEVKEGKEAVKVGRKEGD